MPPALPGEFSFASSGTCVTTQGGRNAWIATGGATIARILATRDGGNTWNAYNTPLASSPSGGAFTVDFRNPFDGIVGGGDLDPANPNSADTAISNDGGQTWTLTNPPPVTGAIFGLSYVGQTGGGAGNNLGRAVVVTANDGGAAWTPDEGNTWFTLPGVTGYWAVAFASPKAGWLVGTDGRILRFNSRTSASIVDTGGTERDSPFKVIVIAPSGRYPNLSRPVPSPRDARASRFPAANGDPRSRIDWWQTPARAAKRPAA